MSNILTFPGKKDDELICRLEIDAEGQIELILNAWRVETDDQHNWLIAKIAEAVTRLVDRKNELRG
jgi:hypothetical protein